MWFFKRKKDKAKEQENVTKYNSAKQSRMDCADKVQEALEELIKDLQNA